MSHHCLLFLSSHCLYRIISRELSKDLQGHEIRSSFLGWYIAEHLDRVPEGERDSTLLEVKLLVELVGLFMRSNLI
jgi:hypothetical protein